ncbi:hypothetical protein MTR67_046753 [Solanum verrucosum]|uniref:Uncharacterized protein n=1 Tax=Solanum verrucosum TaxID=315347 RepID=A0AAF0UY04_SOLVR|nr:hypothetical protein MTR67_046753 [Solanum verrucosum]
MKFFKHKKETQKEEEEIENLETISLCDLQMNNYEGYESPKISSSSEEFFEFLNESSHSFSDIIFCGKIIRHENESVDQEKNLSPLFRSNSFHRHITAPVNNQNRASSARFYSSQERVNISGLTSMSAKSRRKWFMFGPVKFNPEMELSEIKQRQGRRRCALPLPVIPMSKDGGDTTALEKSRKKKKESGPTGKLMELTSRPHFVNVLAKSLRCFSLRKHCMALP